MKHRWRSVACCFLLLLVNSGNLWGAEKPRTAMRNTQSQDRLAQRPSFESDPDLQESRSERYKLLEWVIMQDLLAKYQKLEKNEIQVDIDD